MSGYQNVANDREEFTQYWMTHTDELKKLWPRNDETFDELIKMITRIKEIVAEVADEKKFERSV